MLDKKLSRDEQMGIIKKKLGGFVNVSAAVGGYRQMLIMSADHIAASIKEVGLVNCELPRHYIVLLDKDLEPHLHFIEQPDRIFVIDDDLPLHRFDRFYTDLQNGYYVELQTFVTDQGTKCHERAIWAKAFLSGKAASANDPMKKAAEMVDGACVPADSPQSNRFLEIE